MRYLSAKHILLLHSLALEKDGGMSGVRNMHVVLSLEDLPRQNVFGEELYPTVFHKAAVYTRNIIMSHPFVDGNKRTGILVALVFLEKNGYKFFSAKGDIEKFAISIIIKRLTIEQIAKWLKKHSRKT